MEEIIDYELNNNDETIQLIKEIVDYLLYEYSEWFTPKYSLNERDELILKTYKLIRKKYLSSQNTHWDKKKKFIIGVIAKSYLVQDKFVKSK